jgi:hypothetical protein
MNQSVKDLIRYIITHAEKESSFLYPDPAWTIDAHDTIDQISMLWGIDKQEVSNFILGVQNTIKTGDES